MGYRGCVIPSRFLLGLVALFLTTACAAPSPDSETTGADSGGADSTASAPAANSSSPASGTTPAASLPITLDNCGYEFTLTQAPDRILTLKSTTAELVLALGLGDKLVAAGALDAPLGQSLTSDAGAVPLDLADTIAAIPVIEGVPGFEATLMLEPDLIFAGWESNVGESGAGGRVRLAQAGVQTYVSPAACQAADYAPNPMTFEVLFSHLAQAGVVLGAPEAAQELIATQRSQLAAITPDDRGLRALWYSSGTDTPFVGAGTGVPQMVMEAAGLVNVAADVPGSWSSLSWEEAIARAPDVIVLVDSLWNTAENKRERLRTDPLLSHLPAVKNERFIVVDFPDTEAGIGNVRAAASIAAQLADLPMGGD